MSCIDTEMLKTSFYVKVGHFYDSTTWCKFIVHRKEAIYKGRNIIRNIAINSVLG